VRASSSCNAGEALLIRLNSSEPGAGYNNSHAQLPNDTYDSAWGYSVCCTTDAFRSITNACGAKSTSVLNLYNTTDSHVQASTQAGYAYTACLNVTYGNVTCEYVNSACDAGYSPVVSIASSEAGDNNLTNAHVGDYSYYLRKVCCQIGGQSPPNVAWVNLTPINTTTRLDLECQNGTTTDPDGDSVSLAYNWYRNGTSITVLNMPMDYDSISGKTHDFSGYGNDGTVNGATFLPTGGYVGGAFSFNGANLGINSTNSSALNDITNFTLCAWITPSLVGSSHQCIACKGNSTHGWEFSVLTTGRLFYTRYTTEMPSSTTSIFGVVASSWQQVCVVDNNKDASLAAFYINGHALGRVPPSSGTGAVQSDALLPVTVGVLADNTRNFNGTIDEVIVFNRSLTSQEILTLYNTNNRFLNSTELRRTEGWNCSITPIDSTGINGTTKYSNMTIVKGSAPLAPNLIYPANNNQTAFERFMNFTWSGADERDGDAVTYNFNLSVAAGACSVQTQQSGIAALSYSFGELCTDQLYSWNVTACDIDGCSAPSAMSNFTVQSVAGLKLVINQTQFGIFDRGQSRATDADNITPFIVNNTGNVRINITLAGNSSPFSTAPLPTGNYTYKAGANATNAFDTAGSQTSYIPVDSAYQNLVKRLNYSNQAAGYAFGVNSTARIDMNITAPVNEPPGNKQANITVSAVRSTVTS
jgi:hypothetical protein